MEVNINIHGFDKPKLIEWRHGLDFTQKLVLSSIFACLIGLAAQIRFYIPWSPVPITGQTFAVLLGAVVLGKNWGGLSTSIYVGLGAAGVPWFTGWTGGMGTMTGATGGYLLGFVAASFFIGYMTDNHSRSKNFSHMLSLMSVATFVVIYGFGLAHLYLWSHFVVGSTLSMWGLLMMGAVPFLLGDVLKVFASAAVANRIGS